MYFYHSDPMVLAPVGTAVPERLPQHLTGTVAAVRGTRGEVDIAVVPPSPGIYHISSGCKLVLGWSLPAARNGFLAVQSSILFCSKTCPLWVNCSERCKVFRIKNKQPLTEGRFGGEAGQRWHFSSASSSFVVTLLAFNVLNIDLKCDTMQLWVMMTHALFPLYGCRLTATTNPLLNVNLSH